MKAGRMLPRRVHPTWQPYLGIMRDGDDANTPTPDLEALGINVHGEEIVSQQEKPLKKMSKNKKKLVLF